MYLTQKPILFLFKEMLEQNDTSTKINVFELKKAGFQIQLRLAHAALEEIILEAGYVCND